VLTGEDAVADGMKPLTHSRCRGIPTRRWFARRRVLYAPHTVDSATGCASWARWWPWSSPRRPRAARDGASASRRLGAAARGDGEHRAAALTPRAL